MLEMEFLLVKEKMKNKILYTVTDINFIEKLKEEGITTFLFPFKGYSVGYLNEFSLKEIKEANSYLLLNRLLDTTSIKQLIDDLDITKIRGLVVEDLGVYSILKEHNLKTELILYQQHFNTNLKTINYQLNYFDSVVISSDITIEQIENILNKAKKPLCLYAFGLMPAMYSRRNLLTHYQQHFNLKENKVLNMEEKVSKKEFIAIENEYGTVIYSKPYYNAININHDNIKFKIINPILLSLDEQIELVKSILNEQELKIETDQGFLHTKTIYRVKGN